MPEQPGMANTSAFVEMPGLQGFTGVDFSIIEGIRFHPRSLIYCYCSSKESHITKSPICHGTFSPKWMKKEPGLSFLGKCANKTCEAYKSPVASKILRRTGFGKFDVGRDTIDCVCPQCYGTVAEINNCSLSSCKWSFEGIQLIEDPSNKNPISELFAVKRTGKGTADGKGVYTFTGRIASWRHLQFTISRLSKRTANMRNRTKLAGGDS